MSELGEAGSQNAVVMNTLGTPLLGASIILFALALKIGLEKIRATQYGSIVVLIGGICLVLGGIFPCDPGCIPVTFTGKMHKTVANIGFTGIILAPFFLANHFKKIISWKRYWLPTLSVGIITAFLVPIFLWGVFNQWNGAIQRILLGVLLLWIEAISFKFIREYQ
jgi:hypothetical membrane protein